MQDWPPLTDEQKRKLGVMVRPSGTRAPLKTAKEVEKLLWVLGKKHEKPPYWFTIGVALRFMRHLAWRVIRKQNWWTWLAIVASLAVWAYILFGFFHVERAWGDTPSRAVPDLSRDVPYTESGFQQNFEKEIEQMKVTMWFAGCRKTEVYAYIHEKDVPVRVTATVRCVK